ncbi:hypothetical protein GIB67_030046 [Kingdonia uniflora]|uniref:DNA 5'-3' helicase FANCJ n=1 Tax=Kingdonia uniflora TaxID=39325 RepID=A0A7J7MYM8_9MAGN|nr:hypothetical protein GIB67_030046 [Kingdonia uniflora]
MDSSTCKSQFDQKPNPHPNSANIYHIGGIPVDFPYKPYGSQLAFMSKVISTLDRGKKQGHSHALLESPTGTGKSLSLLCSALAWQQNYRSKNLYANLSHSNSNTNSTSANEFSTDPLLFGGGFVPEPEPSSNLVSGNAEPTSAAKGNRSQKKKAVPTIFYASRTHSQISQVIREYRKTSYRVPMAVLASRKHYCTNKHVCGGDNIDEECKLLLKERDRGDAGCLEFRNVNKVKGYPSLQKGGCHEAHDIEDLVKVGRTVKGCSYFAARSMAEEAQLIFCPYSYIMNPTIRRAMEVDLKEAIVILDEAHNIEDMAREAGSVDVEEDMLYTLQTELEQLCLADQVIYQPLHDMIQGVTSWIGQRKNTLEKHEFQHYCSWREIKIFWSRSIRLYFGNIDSWTGDKALKELQEVGISQQVFPILKECATKAIKAVSDAESESDAQPVLAHLSGLSVIALEGLISSLGYFFSENGIHTIDYQLVLQRIVKRDSGRSSSEWTHTFSLWCLNPAVAFREITDLSMSVILTSGTLSPMNSFSSELGVQFDASMEAPHVIDVESQLFAAVISTGPGNYPLNASYKTADVYPFQDALGASIEEICKIVPAGALVFFPSYKLMEKLCTRWSETGQWSRLNAQKSFFVEPRGNQDDFELVLKGYYNSIRQVKRPGTCKVRRGKKQALNHVNVMETSEYSVKGGAAFLAVCRGKVSEGIDFSDDNARVVIIVGIPFSNIKDIQVAQKKRYNDTYKSLKGLLSGSEWYCQQAFRALNQAAGRCIRHRFDYGGIIFLDERFKEERNVAYVSKWIRKSIKQYESFEMSLEGLRSFFQEIKVQMSQEKMHLSESSNIIEEYIPFTEPMLSKGTVKRKNRKTNKPDHRGEKIVSNNISATGKASQFFKPVKSKRNDDYVHPNLNTQGYVGPMVSAQTDHSGRKSVSNETAATENVSRFFKFVKLEKIDNLTFPKSNTQGYVGRMASTQTAQKDVASFSPQESRLETTSITSSSESPGQVLVKETPGICDSISKGSPGILYKEDNPISTALQVSNDLSDQLSCSPLVNTNGALCEGMCDPVVTPEKVVEANIYDLNPEIEATLNLSVNSHAQKRRKSMFSISYPQMDQFHNDSDAGSPSDLECVRRMNTSMNNKRLHLCCSICRNSLGLPENQFLITCSFSSSSKVHLTSVLKSASVNGEPVPVVISEISSVDRRLYNRPKTECDVKNGIWCEKDGCVFKTIFCPLCDIPDTLLGLQIMATDAANVYLLNKILFYPKSLEVKNLHAPNDQTLLRAGDPDVGQVLSDLKHKQIAIVAPLIENFSYVAEQQTSEGWITTKSRLKLPKRGLFSATQS